MSLNVEKCLLAWTNSLRQMNAKADIVFFGDSMTYYGDFATVFPNKVVCNLGLRGDTLQGMIDRVEQVRLLEPKFVYLMAGINDVACCSLDEFARRYDQLVSSLIENVLGVGIIIQNLLPVNNELFSISCTNEQIGKYNELISHIAAKYNLCCLDLFSLYAKDNVLPVEDTIDGIHLNQNAYDKWINLLQKNIVEDDS